MPKQPNASNAPGENVRRHPMEEQVRTRDYIVERSVNRVLWVFQNNRELLALDAEVQAEELNQAAAQQANQALQASMQNGAVDNPSSPMQRIEQQLSQEDSLDIYEPEQPISTGMLNDLANRQSEASPEDYNVVA